MEGVCTALRIPLAFETFANIGTSIVDVLQRHSKSNAASLLLLDANAH